MRSSPMSEWVRGSNDPRQSRASACRGVAKATARKRTTYGAVIEQCSKYGAKKTKGRRDGRGYAGATAQLTMRAPQRLALRRFLGEALLEAVL